MGPQFSFFILSTASAINCHVLYAFNQVSSRCGGEAAIDRDLASW